MPEYEVTLTFKYDVDAKDVAEAYKRAFELHETSEILRPNAFTVREVDTPPDVVQDETT